ncbi:MAG: polyribonucleotide nucleotidyltransferase [Armatimonadetes bacterium CG2_30_59_28]|nr:polyribonucleotide nucleotidyltransferase [Armatimonadota bacterium]OIO97203.1 MAG: polyribonucleotide nucleotidyltransferase [Armatimonadetes bacterium CG2_30_59_28]PIU62899.1 MAG: polyribonucleotide nucleotidyltransferase [Armatimonadetes bacterium CG07_land_8_20_14_0_80_59_28]PIX39984.1 MAG: polyribonucleotide nucleotidyltransferase [Armatimonadetes bacterium CG_4_8_14_3_um_filter_58_9]PIY43106.1 MAG: polyribonucleotide nucleotidyltransferase [Armatimonadetes bacterium CG_4_10_14_3_um_fil
MAIQDKQFEMEWGGRPLVIEAGTLAQQANGSVTVQYGDTMVLATAVCASPRPGIDFFPLTVDFEERMYAAGRIPGSRFVRREGRPSEKGILTARLIDRTIRPLFPKGFMNEVHVVVTTLSADAEIYLDIPGMIGVAAALGISDIPFNGPAMGVKVGYVEGEYILNPTYEQLDIGDLELVLGGSRKGINMIETGARQLSEELVSGAVEFGWKQAEPAFTFIENVIREIGKPKLTSFAEHVIPPEAIGAVEDHAGGRIRKALQQTGKADRDDALNVLRTEVLESLLPQFEDNPSVVREAFEEIAKKQLRALALEEGKRVDGRGTDDIRPLRCQVGFVPRAHGSALFSRGETQAINVTTLGSVGEEKLMDSLGEEESKRFMHHYNFPPYSVGESKPMRGPGRREIGHGALVEKALLPVVPEEEVFPYTIRVVSEILSSNGSTSMASVCGTTLSLMDAGVPITDPVAGISIGLVMDDYEAVGRGDGHYFLLTDIMGIEDHCGDMDFKVAGTRNGITAIQLDLKAEAIPIRLIPEVLERARQARYFILDTMAAVLAEPRPELSEYAPRILTLQIPVDKIGGVIGPGGKMIRAIIERTGAKIDIEDDGMVFIASTDPAGGQEAYDTIQNMVKDVEVGEEYTGKVVRILPFGAFVELLPGKDGLVHISELAWEHVPSVEDVVNIGDEVTVRVKEIDDQGRVNLTRRELLPKPEGYVERPHSPRPPRRSDGPPRGGRSRY